MDIRIALLLLVSVIVAKTHAALVECGFENDKCNLEDDNSDDFDWSRRTEKTITWYTGPYFAQEGNYYIHIEASLKNPGDTASLMTPVIQSAGDYCVDFWYHMYGSDIEELRLQLQTSSDRIDRQTVWSEAGNKGDEWMHHRITVQAGVGNRIVFTGVRGNGNAGDIAIDTVRITEEDCAVARAEKRVVILLDVSASVKDHLPKVTSFLQDFFTITSSDEFFGDHPTDLTVVPFDMTIRDDEEWMLQYSAFQTAAELRASERNDMADFLADIDTREPTASTNIGQSLKAAFDKYHPLHQHWIVILVSDFINRHPTPTIAEALDEYRTNGIHVFPVLVDKEIVDEETFNNVKLGTEDNFGINGTDGVNEADIHNFYALSGEP